MVTPPRRCVVSTAAPTDDIPVADNPVANNDNFAYDNNADSDNNNAVCDDDTGTADASSGAGTTSNHEGGVAPSSALQLQWRSAHLALVVLAQAGLVLPPPRQWL
mmetsp:Transcript_30097/g.75999  ORF Transcript_30097/g.75999 Transcript_30097/m.75999 type:complete len:105 (+) Transcript_30097:1551-1865(+)